MTVTALHSPALAGMLDGAREAVREAASVPVATVGTAELGASITALAELESQVVALRMSLSAEADARRVAEETAHTGTDAWLAQLTGDTRAALAGGLRIARLLQQKYDATREAFAAGRLRLPQVRVIVDAAEQAPPEATPEQVRAAEELLVARATGDATRSGRPTDARRLRQVARRMFDPIDRELADRHEAILLGRETRTAEAETFLALHDNGNGTFSGRFLIPELHGNLLRHALERLTAPRRLSRDRAGERVTDPTALGTGCGAHIYETRGAAFLELLEHLPTTGHGPTGTELLVTIDLEALLSGLGTAGLDTGVRITAGDARRLACEAGLVPAVLGGRSVPLDLGRRRRLHDGNQRRALSLIHDTCAIAGCERPIAWCEIHHLDPWSQGGRTDLDRALPACGHHHRRIHDSRWDLRRRSDGEWAFHRRT
jgi:hypothetical protein